MSNTAPRPYLVPTPEKHVLPRPLDPGFDPLLLLRAGCLDTPPVHQPAAPIRRRATQQQGKALEVLGHAVEYLIDSRMFQLSEVDRASETEALQTLMLLSREVFSECEQVVTLRGRVQRWLDRNVRFT